MQFRYVQVSLYALSSRKRNAVNSTTFKGWENTISTVKDKKLDVNQPVTCACSNLTAYAAADNEGSAFKKIKKAHLGSHQSQWSQSHNLGPDWVYMGIYGYIWYKWVYMGIYGYI